MKRSINSSSSSSRSQRLLSLGRQSYALSHGNDENLPPPESPCPVPPDDPEYLSFAGIFDNGQRERSHITPPQQTKNCSVKPPRKALGNHNNAEADSVELRSPPKKIPNTDKGETIASGHDEFVAARRSLQYEQNNSGHPRRNGSLAVLQDDILQDHQSGVQLTESLGLSKTSTVLSTLPSLLSEFGASFTPLTEGLADLHNNGITSDNIKNTSNVADLNNNGPSYDMEISCDDNKIYTELQPVSELTFKAGPGTFQPDALSLETEDAFDSVLGTQEKEVLSDDEVTASLEDIPPEDIPPEDIHVETPVGNQEPIDLVDTVLGTQEEGVVSDNVVDASQGVDIFPEDIRVEETPLHDQEPVAEPTVNDEDQFPKAARSRNPDKWKQKVVKKLKESGQAHVSLKGKVREAKSMGAGCSDKCKRKCHSNFTPDDRSGVFKKFYAIENHTTKWYFIANHVKCEDVKRRTVVVPHGCAKKSVSNAYYLPLNGAEKQVCRKFFMDTLAISEKCVRTALEKKKQHTGSIPTDGRGKIKKQRVVSTVIREDIMKHIKKYNTIEGHYTRKSSKARYLPEFLNRRMMHSQYLVEKEAEGVTENVATLRQYRDVFKREFNLKFFKPKKDQCSKCLSWKNKTSAEKTEVASQKFLKHISDKKISQDLKTEDILFVKQTPNVNNICVATCDLEKVFLCPKGENSEFFYKSKLSLYNFTIFVSGEQKGFCYVWDQTEGRRGAAEIGSCLWSFFKMKSEQGVKEFRLYSDNCSAQNKNQFLFSMYIMASIRLNIRIVHRYLETGHTHMEVDSVHAAIQNSLKNKDIFIPSEWYAAIKLAKKSLPKYEVHELKQGEIYNFSNLAAHQTWEQIRTSEFKEVVFDGTEPGYTYYKTQYDGDAVKTKVIKRKPGHPVNWKTISLQKMYSGPIPLRPIEIKDLQHLCDVNAIPSRYHNFYQNKFAMSRGQAAVHPPPPHVLPDVEDSSESEQEQDSDDNNT